MKRTRVFVGIAALCLALPLLSACTAQNESLSMGGAEMLAQGATDSAALDSSDFATEDMTAADERSIISTGSMEIEIDDVATATQEVAKVVDDLGGEISSQQVSGMSDTAQSASITIRVPSERFSDAFDSLAELGTVRYEQRSSDDVSEMHVDLAARVAALETSVGRLTDLLAEADSTSDLLEIETALSQRQAELDGLKAQLTSLEDQVDRATISVGLVEPSVLPGGGPQNFWEGLLAGIASIGGFASGFVIFVGIMLPWLIVLGAIAAAVLIPLRIRKRKRSPKVPTDSVVITQND